MFPNSLPYKGARNRLIDLLHINEEEETAFTLGLTPPLTDIPFAAATSRVAFQQEATIVLSYSEPQVIYRLFARDTASSGNDSASPIGEDMVGTGGPLRFMSNPMTEDLDFIIGARKQVKEQEITSFLRGTSRVVVGVDVDIPVQLVREEINYQERAQVVLPVSQAGVTYAIYSTTNTRLSPDVIGNEGQIILTTHNSAMGRLREDTRLVVRAKRADTGGGLGQALTIQPIIRVRANPSLQLVDRAAIVDFNGNGTLRIQNTQSSVRYRLFSRPLDSLEFWQNRSATPSSPTVSIAIPIPGNFPPSLPSQPQVIVSQPDPISDGLIPDYYQAASNPLQGNGGTLSIPTNNFQADSVLLILAEKNGHDQAVVLESAFFVLTRPRVDIRIQARPNPVPAGSTTNIELQSPEEGVKYFILAPDNTFSQVYAYQPQAQGVIEGNPVQNTIGRLKVGVDFFTGPPPASPLSLQSPRIPANGTYRILAVKAQTLLSALQDTPLNIQTS